MRHTLQDTKKGLLLTERFGNSPFFCVALRKHPGEGTDQAARAFIHEGRVGQPFIYMLQGWRPRLKNYSLM